MKHLVFLEILALATIVCSQTDETSSTCPEGLEKAVNDAFELCPPPKRPEGSQNPPPPPPPSATENGECPGKCLITEFEKNEVLKEFVTECPEENYPRRARIDCIMNKAKELCPDADFGPPAPPAGGPQGGPPDGPRGAPLGGPRGG